MTSLLLFLSLISTLVWTPSAHSPILPTVTCPLESAYTPPVESTQSQDAIPGIPPVVEMLNTPDGSVFAVITQPEGSLTQRIYRYDPANGETTEILSAETLRTLRTEDFAGGVQVRDLTFIPNTHIALFYTAIIPNVEGIYFEVPLDVWALDVDSGELTEIFPYGEGGLFSISPSGDKLVLFNIDKIRVSAPDGSNVSTIYEGRVGLGGGEYIAWSEIVWVSPDAFRTALLDAPLDAPDGGYAPTHPTRMVEFDLSGESPTMTEFFSVTGVIFFSVRLSPQGDAISYLIPNDDGENQRDLVIQRIGADPVMLSSGDSIENPVWLDDLHIGWSDGETRYIGDVCGVVSALP